MRKLFAVGALVIALMGAVPQSGYRQCIRHEIRQGATKMEAIAYCRGIRV